MIRMYNWYGGKIRMIHEIIALVPEHNAWYEPFMGSAAVTLNHKRSDLEVMNDLDTDLVCLMRTIADREKGVELIKMLSQLWYDKLMFDEAMEQKKQNFKGMSEIEKSVSVYILITQSFNSTRKNFRKGITTWRYRQDIRYHVPKVYERLRDVRICNMNAIDLLGNIQDNPNAFVFLDPPYRKELRGVGADKVYTHELPYGEQIRLLKTIRQAKCKIMLCGYRQEKGIDLYDTYLLSHGWKCYKLKEVIKACQTIQKKDSGQEMIWVNYKLPEHAKYVISMKEYSSL